MFVCGVSERKRKIVALVGYKIVGFSDGFPLLFGQE